MDTQIDVVHRTVDGVGYQLIDHRLIVSDLSNIPAVHKSER
ncbi:hypothetical protein GCM10008018_67740 [Paenibacillus marchantiophytorum]|uniref:Uncharacterized protein n=1 Tax=Paenibacillus marchantiophytorum TaxID=1619310 RepID=A0ABQ1FIZ3_9BACL|nr:hypothetical protein GCM10008018_67740 [Paenibacillus marchantiophytorum]